MIRIGILAKSKLIMLGNSWDYNPLDKTRVRDWAGGLFSNGFKTVSP